MMNRRPYSFILILIFAAASTASIALQNILWLALTLWGYEQYRSSRTPLWPQGPFLIATILFVATYFSGAAFGVDPANSTRSVAKYLILFAWIPVAAMRLDEKRTATILLAFTTGSAFCAVYGIGKYVLGIEGRISSFSGHWMVFGGLLMLASLVQTHLTLSRPKWILNWLLLILVAVGLVLTQTRGAWFGFAAGFAWYAWKVEKKLLVWGFFAALVGSLFLPAPLKERIHSIWDSKLSYSNMERVSMWKAGLAIHRDHPIFGIGQGNMEKVYPSYKVPEALEPVVGHMHNNFMQILVQNGWLGLIAFLAWILCYFIESARYHPDNRDVARLQSALTAAFLATLVWGLTEYTFHQQYTMVLVVLIGLQWGLRNGNTSEELGVRS